MKKWVSVLVVAACVGTPDGLRAQNPVRQETVAGVDGPAPSSAAGPQYPDQPVMPQQPRLQPRGPDMGPAPHAVPLGSIAPAPDAQQPPPPPFTLTPVEEAHLDRVLLFWEQSSQGVRTFRCKFTRFEYDPVWGPPDKPRFVDEGELRYAAPDKGAYVVGPPREERWICDGKSIYEYDYQKKQVIEHKLPPEVQGKAMAQGPIPFLFGAKAEHLKRRYWLRIITPPDAQNEVWLEAYPRTIEDAQNFKRAELILAVRENDMQPSAVQIFHPNGKNRTVYSFREVVINKPDLRHVFEDPFHARVPSGWQKVVEEAPQLPATSQGPGRRSPLR